MGRATTTSRYADSTPTSTPTPTASKIHYSGTPQTSATTNGGITGGGFGHQGFKMLIPPSIVFTPEVRELGQELADKLASATYITPQELRSRFPDTQADIQAQLNELNRIQSAQRLEKVRALPPAETTFTQNGITFNCVGTKCEVISQPTASPTSSVISILPFAIVGIVLIVILLFLRRRS